MPKSSDPYRWKIMSGKEDTVSGLFSKNLSDHSIGAYRELCEGLDKIFEAVPPTLTALDTPNSLVPV